jgi:hypothetical protein
VTAATNTLSPNCDNRSLSPTSSLTYAGIPFMRRDLWVKTSRIISPLTFGRRGMSAIFWLERVRFKVLDSEGVEDMQTEIQVAQFGLELDFLTELWTCECICSFDSGSEKSLL